MQQHHTRSQANPRASRVAWLLLAACLGTSPAFGIAVTGSDWRVYFNLPDQNSGAVAVGEFDIREALLARINALQAGQTGTLSTYTFSGNTASSGAAGPIISAITRALDTGAVVRFIADSSVNVSSNFNSTNSLASLAARATNALVLVQETNTSLIMHNKFALFDYGAGNRWVFTGSWNYTGGASTFQWNIAIEVRNDVLYDAYISEAAELLAGHFHNNPPKSHAHDGTSFFVNGSWGNSTVRFSPPPDGSAGGNNPETDILNLISNAESEIVFGLNQITLTSVAGALVAAADRGITIHGAIPLSDAGPGGSSTNVYDFLANSLNYATSNRVNFVTPYSKADRSALDAGESDLIHAKYMVIDPFGTRPVAIAGSPNWTQQALLNTNGNDENLLILRHRDIARMYYAQFRRMTGAFTNRADFWCAVDAGSAPQQTTLWMTDTNRYSLEHASAPGTSATWQVWQSAVTGRIGQIVLTNGATGSVEWIRARREP